MNKKITHCKYGHQLEGNNLLVRKEGWINCRKCMNFRSRGYMMKKRKCPIDKYKSIRELFEASKHQILYGDKIERGNK